MQNEDNLKTIQNGRQSPKKTKVKFVDIIWLQYLLRKNWFKGSFIDLFLLENI